MTVEEAVEVILGGVFWCGCEDCKASGLVALEEGRPPAFANGSLDRYLKAICSRCGGTGSMPRPPYEEACRLLGKPLPRYVVPNKVVDVDPEAWAKWKKVYFRRGQLGQLKTQVEDYDED